MKYSEFSRKTFYSILSFYGELIEKDIIMSAPEIGRELGYNASTIRRFIDQVKKTTYIYQDENERIKAERLYEEILLHTKLSSHSEKYEEQQLIRRKRFKKLFKQKVKEYYKKKD